MCKNSLHPASLAIAIIISPCIAASQEAQEKQEAQPAGPPARAWSNITTLSYVATSGNGSLNTIGFSNGFTKKWTLATLAAKCGMLRSVAMASGFTAIGDSLEDIALIEDRAISVTAENYYFNARLDYKLKDKDKWYWYTGSSWERNLPLGIGMRLAYTAGFGRILADTEKTKWRADLGLGATREEPTNPPPGFKKDFGTANLTTGLQRRFTETVAYSADMSLIHNLRDRQDWLSAFKQGLTVAMGKGTALKIGFDMHYRNKPTLIPVKVFSPGDPHEPIGEITISAKKLDTVATTSLVVSF